MKPWNYHYVSTTKHVNFSEGHCVFLFQDIITRGKGRISMIALPPHPKDIHWALTFSKTQITVLPPNEKYPNCKWANEGRMLIRSIAEYTDTTMKNKRDKKMNFEPLLLSAHSRPSFWRRWCYQPSLPRLQQMPPASKLYWKFLMFLFYMEE